MIRSLAPLVACAALLWLCSLEAAYAESAEVEQAKGYFKAGAAAYELGDYQAAIQALEVAYRLTPLPAIAFSLAQAERRQYFVSKEHAHLERAIELYTKYLHEVTSGGRRADATDALSQLEPLALATPKPAEPAPGEAAAPRAEKTRLLISCAAPGALVALDDAAAETAPLIAQVTPGQHRVRVTAKGFFAVERSVSALAGELVPLEVVLREQPAVVLLRAEPEAELHIDGAFIATVGIERRLELASGAHRFSFARAGYRVENVDTRLVAGTTREIVGHLHMTEQRIASLVLLAASGAGFVSGITFTSLAVYTEDKAKLFLASRERGNVSATELSDYRHSVDRRDRFRALAVGSFVASAVALVTGVSLYVLDAPHGLEPPPLRQGHAPEVNVSLPLSSASPLGVDTRWRF